jgi:hypothetical protein
MPARKLTITVPESIAVRFLRVVPSQLRSEWVVDAMTEKLRRRDEQLIAACEALNADPNVLKLERDMDSLSGDGLDEHPWNHSASR